MADAVRLISIRRGYDPRDFALVAFGGAGPLHGAALAARALDPDRARAAEPGHHLGARLPARRHPPRPRRDVPAPAPTRPIRPRSRPSSQKLEAEARERLARRACPRTQMSAPAHRSPCATWASGARWRCRSTGRSARSTPRSRRFHAEHEREYTYRRDGAPVEIYQLEPTRRRRHAEAGARPPRADGGAPRRAARRAPGALRRARRAASTTPIYERDDAAGRARASRARP